MRSLELTEKQKEVLEALHNYIADVGFPPSYRDLMEMVSLRSPATIKGHLDKLKAKGFITWEPGLPRTMTILMYEKTAS